MKWILTLALTAMASTALADLPLASDHLPLASDQHKARTAECPCGTVCPCAPCQCADGNYEWRACQDRGQVALYYDGAQIGTFRYGVNRVSEAVVGDYYPFDGETWAKHPLPYGSLPKGTPWPPKQRERTCSPSTGSVSSPYSLASPASSWSTSGNNGGRIMMGGGFRGGFRGGCSGGG